jgi:hypothetical protein
MDGKFEFCSSNRKNTSFMSNSKFILKCPKDILKEIFVEEVITSMWREKV